MEKRKVVNVVLQDGKYFIEIMLPHAFVCFPITRQGLAQILEDVDKGIQQIVDEEEALSEN